jgi:hypothetical protein
MENFSPSRIQPLSNEPEKKQEESVPRKSAAPRSVSIKKPEAPPVDLEQEDPHTLDEQA